MRGDLARQRFPRLLASMAFVTCALSAAPQNATAAEPVTPGSGAISLEQMLIKGLKCRRPIEFQYVRTVVNMVDDGQLPESLVRSTFFWAWQKYRRPLQYFQEALTIRAARLGILVPGFDSDLSTASPTPLNEAHTP
jgi:hypothetical protein